MTCSSTQPPTVAQDTSRPPVLYMALELSKETCLALSGTGRVGHPIRRVKVSMTSQAIFGEIERARRRFGLPEAVEVVAVYEAGFCGWWLYRELTSRGVRCVVTKPCTVRKKRGKRSPKTDRLDAEALLKALIRYHRDGEDDLRPVEVPGIESEDLQRVNREREVLLEERGQHDNRVRSVLQLHGILVIARGLELEDLSELRCADGGALPPRTKASLERELVRRNLVVQQLRELEEERREVLRAEETECARQCKALMKLKGIGEVVSWVLSSEIYSWRTLKNRRQVGHVTGLVGTPHQSGVLDRDLGIRKTGRSQVRRILVEAAWLWLRWQPESELSKWFHRRFGEGKRSRRVGIVAVARKLAILLWRYLRTGVIPEGAVLKTAC